MIETIKTILLLPYYMYKAIVFLVTTILDLFANDADEIH